MDCSRHSRRGRKTLATLKPISQTEPIVSPNLAKASGELKLHYEEQGRASGVEKNYGGHGVETLFFRRRRELIARLIPPAADCQMALDVGCGVGIYCVDLLQRKYEAIAFDLSSSYVKSARLLVHKTRLGDGAHFLVGDAQALPFRSEVFNLILCSEVLEHLPNPKDCLTEICRAMKLGGQLILTMPSGFSPTEVVRHFLGDMEHLHRFPPTSITRAFRSLGLIIVGKMSCNFFAYWFGPVSRISPNLRRFLSRIAGIWRTLDECLGQMPIVKLFGWCFVVKARKRER